MLRSVVARRAAVAAAVVFWPALFLFAALYPGYTHLHRAISGLGAFGAPHALAWNVIGFIVPGLLLAASAARIALAIDGRRTLLFWLLVTSGLGFAGAGVFPAEMWNGIPRRESPWTAAHIAMIFASGVPWVVAAVMLARRVARDARWRQLKGRAFALAILAVASLSANVFADAIPLLADANGLAQRIAFVGYFLWFALAEAWFVTLTSAERRAVDVHRRPMFLTATLLSAAGLVCEAQVRAQGRAEPALETRLAIAPYSFEAMDGTVVAAERGELWVSENRSDPDSRLIKLAFVRFASTSPNPGSPIVYLAGGPGGSGVATARGGRFPLFSALRAVADVIAFDQRGTGWSNDVPRCDTGRAYPLAEPLTHERLIPFMREQAERCTRFWKEAGVDIAGYNTRESAADLDALRAALGADKITLWGISYGTHLGLAALKRYPDRIDRAVLASIEDLDETVKLPALTDAYFARVQKAIDADPQAAKAYPDLAALMRSVHAKLDAAPAMLTVQTQGGPTTLAIGKLDLQMLVSRMISDPPNIALLPAMYAGLAAGEYGELGQIVYDNMRKDFGRYAGGMTEAMDVASGITARRLDLVRMQAQSSLLGDVLNFPMPHLLNGYGVPDLGDEFRAPVVSAVPTLFFSGTLDGRTYPESAAATAARFANGTHVLVENAGHNLFMVSPEVTEVILAFLEGQPVARERIVLPTPRFVY